MRDAMTGLVTDRAQVRIAAAGPDGYLAAENWQTAGPIEARYDRNLNTLRSRNVAFEPAYPRYSFPLAIGKTWRGDVRSSQVPAERYGTLLQHLSASVRGWERVTVPAGTFVALRIDIAIDWRNTDDAQVWGNSTESFWYVPQVRNMALHHRVDFAQGRLESNNAVIELESFRVGA
jgi:hypothetical protein